MATSSHAKNPDDLSYVESFVESLVYREVEHIPPSQPCVYFLLLGATLPVTIKVGECLTYQVYARKVAAQAYFLNEVVCLGIQFCESAEDAVALQEAIVRYFTPETTASWQTQSH